MVSLSSLIQVNTIQGVQGASGAQGITGAQGVQGIEGLAGGANWILKTADYTAVAKDQIFCNTTDGSFTITLPSAPNSADYVVIASGPAVNINPLTVSRNGNTIMNLSENLIISTTNISTELVYDGTTWRIS
jgi:hypothetical protein